MTDAVQKLGSIGTRLDLDIRAGCTLGPFSLTFKDGDGNPIDLTGSTLACAASQVDDGAGSDITITATITDAVNGEAQIVLAAASTTGWDATDPAAFAKTKKNAYAWKALWTDSAGSIKPLFYGYINVAAKALP